MEKQRKYDERAEEGRCMRKNDRENGRCMRKMEMGIEGEKREWGRRLTMGMAGIAYFFIFGA